MTVDIPVLKPVADNAEVLNYSIVSDEEIENPLVVKLKVSQKQKIQKVPVVLLKRLNDEYTLSPRSTSRVPKKKIYPDYETSLGFGTPSKKSTKTSPVKKIRARMDENCASPTKTCLDSLECLSLKDCSSPVKLVDNIVQESCKGTPNTRSRVRPRTTSVSSKNKGLTTPSKRPTETDVSQTTSPTKKLRSRSKSVVIEDKMEIDQTPTKYKRENLNEEVIVTGKRSVRTPKRYEDEYIPSPRVNLNESFRRCLLKSNLENVKRTPRTRKNSVSYVYYDMDSEEDLIESPKKKTLNREESCDFVPVTPTTRKRSTKTPKSTTKEVPKTPKNRAKLIRDGVITPSMHQRQSAVVGDTTPLMKARSQLHVSYVPKALPCREKEYIDAYNFIEGKLLDGCGGCMYVSGVPGTGKTATITSIINNLQQNDDIPAFSYVNVNGMRLTEPRQAYVELWKQLTGKTVPWEQARGLLEDKFTKKKGTPPLVMVIDELDILCTKRQDVVYNLLDWPSKAKNQLIVITIANTMDLPERLLMNRVSSRLGLTRLTFQAYTHKQLQEIITKRLVGTDDSFNPDAVQFVARKVASVSGDARRALDLCRKAAEIAEREGKSQQVTMSHVNEALDSMITQPKVMAIRKCSRLEKLVLQAIVAEVERTGVEETNLSDVFKMLVSCCALDGFKMVSMTTAQAAVLRLGACRLILTDQKCNDIFQRIFLNVSVDDVYYALRTD